MPERYAVALAVLVGLAVVGLVLNARLKDISEAIRESPKRADSGQTAPPVTAPPPLDSASAALNEEVRTREATLEALAPQRAQYSKACWKNKNSAGAPEVPYPVEIQLVFDALGRETQRQIKSAAGTPPSFLECLRSQKVAPLSIPGTGREMRTSASVTVP